MEPIDSYITPGCSYSLTAGIYPLVLTIEMHGGRWMRFNLQRHKTLTLNTDDLPVFLRSISICGEVDNPPRFLLQSDAHSIQ